uniref:Uncharacterized protein n=1 Tax=Solanum lycopersicum TaxID=4081 RepID=A0A3Q7F2I4_SOLLC
MLMARYIMSLNRGGKPSIVLRRRQIDQKLTCQVHEIVGRINGRFGTLTAVPIHHLVPDILMEIKTFLAADAKGYCLTRDKSFNLRASHTSYIEAVLETRFLSCGFKT